MMELVFVESVLLNSVINEHLEAESIGALAEYIVPRSSMLTLAVPSKFSLFVYVKQDLMWLIPRVW